MTITGLSVTLQLIRHALTGGKRLTAVVPRPCPGTTTILPSAFAAVLADLDAVLRPDGSLDLLFRSALAPAAPFLLFRLKRTGFSACTATVIAEGIRLTARR